MRQGFMWTGIAAVLVILTGTPAQTSPMLAGHWVTQGGQWVWKEAGRWVTRGGKRVWKEVTEGPPPTPSQSQIDSWVCDGTGWRCKDKKSEAQ